MMAIGPVPEGVAQWERRIRFTSCCTVLGGALLALGIVGTVLVARKVQPFHQHPEAAFIPGLFGLVWGLFNCGLTGDHQRQLQNAQRIHQVGLNDVASHADSWVEREAARQVVVRVEQEAQELRALQDRYVDVLRRALPACDLSDPVSRTINVERYAVLLAAQPASEANSYLHQRAFRAFELLSLMSLRRRRADRRGELARDLQAEIQLMEPTPVAPTPPWPVPPATQPVERVNP
jgi:hypothetical protein